MKYVQDTVDFFATLFIWTAMVCVLGPLLFYFSPLILIAQWIQETTGWLSGPIFIVICSAYFVGTVTAAWEIWKAFKTLFNKLRKDGSRTQTGNLTKLTIGLIVFCIASGMLFGFICIFPR